MAGETVIVVIGNLTADPELRYTQNGLPVVNFTIASTPRTFDRQANEFKDGEALFLRCSAWRELGEHIAGSLTKGSRVIAQGQLKQRSYETKEGEKRTSMELEVDEIGPSLKYATAQVTRAAGKGQGQQGQAPAAGYGPPAAGYGPPQGQQGPPPQQPLQQGYPAPQQGNPAATAPWSAPGQEPWATGQQQAPQQAPPQQGPPQGQYPPPQGQWAGTSAYGDDTPF